MRSLVAAAFVAGVLAQPAQGATAPRLLYSSDWVGADTLYSVDSRTPQSATAQLTAPRQRSCTKSPCGAVDPTPSPNGRWLAYVLVEGTDASLYVARADGAQPRLVSRAVQRASLVWAPGSGRLAYGARDSLFVYDLTRRTSRRADDNAAAAVYTTAWAGPVLAYLRRATRNGPGDLVVRRGQRRRVLETGVWQFALAPGGRRLAYVNDGLRVVNPDGTGSRLVSAGGGNPLWSPDGRRLAAARLRVLPDYRTEYGVVVFDFKTRGQREYPDSSQPMAWSPSGRRLAVTSKGIDVIDLAAGTRRAISTDQATELTWSPAGNEVAYVARRTGLLGEEKGHLRLASLGGRVRTVVDSAGRYGGTIAGVAWTRPPRTMRYRRPQERSLASVSANELAAPWPIIRLAADGGRVAYTACNHVFVWTPATRQVMQAEPVASMMPACGEAETAAYTDIYDLAIAGDQLEYGETYGCNGGQWTVVALALDDPGAGSMLGRGLGSRCGASFDVAFGHMEGAGDLLVYSGWKGTTRYVPSIETVTTSETVYRAGRGPIASREGPLVPLSVTAGRIVVDRGNTFAVLGSNGVELWSVPEHASAAVSDESTVYAAVGDQLRAYDAGTGALRTVFQLPTADVGTACDTPFGAWCGTPPGLLLRDAARGLVAYRYDQHVYVLRRRDGATIDTGFWWLAQFVDGGLVVGSGNRLRLLPFAELE